MGCKHKYNIIKMDDDYGSNMSMKELARRGNKSISGMLGKCPAVKRKGCRK